MPLFSDSSSTQKTAKRSTIADQLLSETLFPSKKKGCENDDNGSDSESSENSAKKDPLASRVWRLYTKAKDNLPNGTRMENLTWRMMAMTLKSKANNNKENTDQQACTKDEDGPEASTTTEMDCSEDQLPTTTTDAIAINNTAQQATTPPAADDTTALLSSSAPPYMMDFLRENISLPFESKNVMVSGSTRASSSTEDMHYSMVSRLLLRFLLSLQHNWQITAG